MFASKLSRPGLGPGGRIRTIVCLLSALSICAMLLGHATAEGIRTTSDSLEISHRPPSANIVGDGVWWTPVLNETSITETLHDLTTWNIPNLYLDVFREGHTLYVSNVFPQRQEATGRDWLAYITSEARNHNIRVHAWIHTLRWQDENSSFLTTHPLLLQHPEWIDLSRNDTGTSAIYVAPGMADVRDALKLLMIELSKYELDGICLDAVEYEPTTDSGYNPAITREFRMAKEADPAGLTIDLDEDSTWMKWVAFREDQLTSLVQLMSETARETAKLTSRTILVSATVQPDYEESRGRNRHYQHWAQWLREGLIDVSIPQCFSNELPGLEQQLWQVRSVHMGSGIACIPGLALDDKKPQNRPSLKDQKQLLSNAGFQHCTILDYEALKAEMERPAKAHDHKKRRFWDLFKRENEEPN